MPEDHTPTFLGARFEIRRRIGAGGMGIVYEAFDRERNASVALKTLKRASPASLLRFKNEFRALADIKHPNLVTLYELISHEDQWFFTMELVEGVDLLSYLRGTSAANAADKPRGRLVPGSAVAPEGEASEATMTADADCLVPPVTQRTMPGESTSRSVPKSGAVADSARLAHTMPQLVAALRAIHESGHLHRDIKPSNILVTPHGRVAVLDFGVVRALSRRHQPHRGGDEIIGTPAFMAPEQLMPGAEPSPASDWYSVGVIFYTALTGCRPFHGTVAEILEAKQFSTPPGPRTIRPDIDPGMERVALGLLRRNPATRLAGVDLVQVLSEPGQAPLSSNARELPRKLDDSAIIGRDRQLAILRDAFAETQHGVGVTVHLHGRSGMGKSTLAAHFIEELDQTGDAVVLSGRCYERESMPYQALDSLVDDLCGYLLELPRHNVEVLLPVDVASLVRAFPVLQRIEAVALARRRSSRVASDPVEIRKRVFVSLRELFARLAQTRPLVLFIDDLQWGDLDSASFLAMLMEQPTPPLLFLISYRDEEAESSPILRRLLGNRPAAQHERDVQVHRLSLQQGCELAEHLLAQAGGPIDSAEQIARESGGNPFFIQEFVRFVVSNAASGQELESLQLGSLIGARVDLLSDDARALLELVALAGSPISHDIARRSAALAEKHPLALAELRAAHLIRSSGMQRLDLVECFHDRIRETVVANLAKAKRAALHLRIAHGIEGSENPDSESLAIHFAAAGVKDAAYEHAVIAADSAAQALAFGRAAAFYERALDLRPVNDIAAAQTLGRKLGDARANAGRGAEAAEAYLMAADASDADNSLQLNVRAGTELLRCGHVEAGLDVLGPALRSAGLSVSSSPWRTLISLLFWRAVIRLRGLRFRERTVAEIRPQSLTRIDATWAGASAFGMADSLRGADIQTRHLLRTMRAGDTARVGRALAFEAAYASFAGPSTRRRTNKIMASVARIATDTRDPRLRGLHDGAAALVAYQYGEWQSCITVSRSAQKILREQCTGVTWELTSAQLYEVWALLWQGKLAEMSACTASFLADARERGDVYSLVNLSTGLPSIAGLVADSPNSTRTRAEHARQQWSREGYHLQHYWSQLALAQADLYVGNSQSASERAERQWKELRRTFFLRIAMVRCEMLQFRARCALAVAAADNNRRMLAAAAQHTRRLAKERIAWCRPATLLLRAGIQRVRNEEADVCALLENASAEFRKADTNAHAWVAEYYLGEFVGGSEGKKLHADSKHKLSEQGVKNLERFARFYAPGLS